MVRVDAAVIWTLCFKQLTQMSHTLSGVALPVGQLPMVNGLTVAPATAFEIVMV